MLGCAFRARSLTWLLLVAFLAVCYGTSNGLNEEEGEAEKEFLVIFTEYSDHSVLSDAIEEALSPFDSSQWSIVARDNRASSLPTDFVLIKTDLSDPSALISAVEKISTVKMTAPNMQYTNSLKDFVVAREEIIHDSHSFTDFCAKQSNECLINGTEPQFVFGRNSAKIPLFDTEVNFQSRNLQSNHQVTHVLNADFLWDKMYTGTGVRVAVFDTGLCEGHPHFRNVRERTDWTDDGTLDDFVGHGTFVAGVIAGSDEMCPGFAPNAELYIYRVFTNSRVSYTSWFLDSFNYAIHSRIDILNLSIGGPDFMDKPFVEKVWEMSANNIIVISAIGNDGPVYGTLNNPADMSDVIGVGGVDFYDKVASFSSRGMTTWELPHGYGRVKPDVLAFGQSVSGSRIQDGCRTLSGTSVASPVVAGAVALLISTIPDYYRKEMVNPASIKQVLLETSELVPNANIFEQGAGRLNLVGAYEALNAYTPRASVFPASLDLTDCPYMWPYCTQPIYYEGVPIIFNLTVLNGMSVVGNFLGEPTWAPSLNGDMIEIGFSYSEIVWPWSGYLALHIKASAEAKDFLGTVEGLIQFTISSPSSSGGDQTYNKLDVPLRIQVIPTPPKHKRILWDQFHNINYPPGFLPNDILWDRNDPFDWNGDHIHTNFRGLYSKLLQLGYHIEVLGTPYTCTDLSRYGTLMIVDPEEEFSEEELSALYESVENGLSLLILADWYNSDLMESVRFFDDNTDKWWTPETGGSNIPALNHLLQPYGIAMGDRVFDGDFALLGRRSKFASGTALSRFPKHGKILSVGLQDQGAQILQKRDVRRDVAILGLLDLQRNRGRIAIFGDSSCMDDAGKVQTCVHLIEPLLRFTSLGDIQGTLLDRLESLDSNYSDMQTLPVRPESGSLWSFSKVFGEEKEWHFSCPSVQFIKSNVRAREDIVVDFEAKLYAKDPYQYEDPLDILHESVRQYLLYYFLFCGVLVVLVVVAVQRRRQSTRSYRPTHSLEQYRGGGLRGSGSAV